MDTNTAGLLLGLLLGLLIGLALGALTGVTWGRSRGTASAGALEARDQRTADQAVLAEGLQRLHDQLRDLEHTRSSWQGQFNQQVLDMRQSTESLRRETQSLATALRRPQVRGRWGEMHLRRAVELAGMVERCDFTEQLHLAGVDGEPSARPDLVIHLAGGRSIVVDAKVPLDAFLDATSADTDEARTHHLERHARQVRRHIDGLARKRYWRALDRSPEFVVLFVPADSFLAAGLEADDGLHEYAAQRRVVLASPSTLIALLRTVAQGWTHQAVGERAAEIHALGRELHERLATMGAHFEQLGRSLNASVGHYNRAMGSWESRVLVSSRRFVDLAVTEDSLAPPSQIDATARAVDATADATTEWAQEQATLAQTQPPTIAARRVHGA
jgi:DNA recombination protein RmuC